jgi:hypothetical protein
MAIRYDRKTRKNKHKYAKNGASLKCRSKTCQSKKYQSVYGAGLGGTSRTTRSLFY